MKKTIVALVCLAIFSLLASGLPATAKPKPAAPCKVYFAVVQRDPSLPNGQAEWLDPQQQKWYAKHGNRGKLAGICYDSAKASYVIQWSGEREKQRAARPWLPSAYAASARGWLFKVGEGSKLVPLQRLTEGVHSGGGVLAYKRASASADLLRDGLEGIAKAEKAKPHL